jgi:hypothetical protein
MFAARAVVDDTSDNDKGADLAPIREAEDPAEGELSPNDDRESQYMGSQYSSEGEDYVLDDVEDYEDIEDDSDRYGAMRAILPEEEERKGADRLSALNTTAKAEKDNRGPIVLKKSSKPMERPKRSAQENQCMTALVSINGLEAFTMFDSGCTADAITPEFAKVANVKVRQLAEPVPLQLGTRGSRSTIHFGVRAPIKYQSIDTWEYFDVVNLDKYDAVMGVAMMRRLGISLDFEADMMRVRGVNTPRMTVEQETVYMARRSAIRRGESAPEKETTVRKARVKEPE